MRQDVWGPEEPQKTFVRKKWGVGWSIKLLPGLPAAVAGGMQLIDGRELKEKLDRGDPFKLVMTLGPFGFRAKHIPGSLNFGSVEEALTGLEPHDEIVVYCADERCPASIHAYQLLASRGYRSVRRYAGGIADWEAAGRPLHGELTRGADEEQADA